MRKISDVILEVENSLKLALALLQNHDLLLKNLSNRIDNIPISNCKCNQSQPNQTVKDQPQVVQNGIKRIPGLKPGVVLANTESGPQLGRIQKDITRKPKMDKPVNVEQVINYGDGSKVCLASYKILQSGNIIKEGKTGSSGKWEAQLSPGVYELKINKHGTSKKPTIDGHFQIEISETDQRFLKLEALKVTE